MTCKECNYHSYVSGVHFCDSKNHKRRTVRISREDDDKNMDCYWADNESEDNNDSI